jgi:hypothetical protein
MNDQERKQGRRQRRIARREQKKETITARYNDISHIIDPNNMYQAFKKSRREVTWKESVQRYEMNLFRNIAQTREKLIKGENIARGFVEFDLMERGRLRHIKSVHISERVVQKTLCDHVLVPMLSRTLIYDNGASIKNKGLHFAIRRLTTHLSRFYRENNFSNDGYCLSIDFSKFFDSIRHDVLLSMQNQILNNPRIMKVIQDFILPFGDGKSLGLGSQVSQISAIFYPNNMDHFIKEGQGLTIKYYGRYMDDLYLIHANKEYLQFCLEKIKDVCAGLGITVNTKKTRIVKLKKGIKFLKGIYSLTKTGKIISRSDPKSRKRMRRKLKRFKTLLEQDKMSYGDVYTAYQSWRGNYLKRFNAYHTVRRMDGMYNALFIK